MSRQPKHQTRTGSGTRAHIRIAGVLHRKHFPTGTDPQDIKEWLLETEMQFRVLKVKRTGRFTDDAKVYLAAVKAMPTYTERKLHIDEWSAVFGYQRRHTITPDQIAAQLALWRTVPREVAVITRGTTRKTRTVTLSASAVNNRRTALMHLFTRLDGKSGPNPVRDVPKHREPSPLPRGLPYAAIEALWHAMGDTQSRARLQMIAYFGLPHAQLASLKPEHYHQAAKTLLVMGRSKGAGTSARTMPVTTHGAIALRAMARTDAWGSFSNSSLRKAFRLACAKVPAFVGLDLTPYDLRHSFGTELYRLTGDIRATQVLMDHSTQTLTHRYTLAAVDPRVQAASAAFEKGAKVPTRVPTRRTTRKKPPRARSSVG